MSLFYNRVKFASTTNGTVDFTVGAAVTGFQTPAGASVPTGTIVSYAAFSASGSEWETGRGAYTSAGTTVARTTVFDSSAGFGTKQSFTANPTVQLDLLGQDLIFSPVLSSWQLGPPDAASPAAQTLKVQSVVAGTTNTAGADFTISGSQGTGTGAGGGVVVKTAIAGGSGSSQNALAQAVAINSTIVPTGVANSLGIGSTGLMYRFGSTTNDKLIFGVSPGTNGSIAYDSNALGRHYVLSGDSSGSGGGAILGLGSTGIMTWQSTARQDSGSPDVIIGRAAAANFRHGDVDAAAPVAQILSVQSVVAGTSNTAGVDWTHAGSKGTGTGAGGKLIFQTAPASTTGTSQNALATGLTITAPAVSMQPSVVVGNQALATTATDGFLYIPTCAGTPTGVPTTQTGMIAMIYDTTNHQFWFYDSGWKQPKTPAGAALVTWQ